MNLLSLVMSILLIFACTFSLSLRKAIVSQEVEKNYQAHMNASHKLRNSYESLCYHRLKEDSKEKKQPKKPTATKEKKIETHNLECARLNLWPLVQEDKEKHRVLYETAAQIIRTFWSKELFNGQRLEYQLLDALLAAAKQKMTEPHLDHLPLEILALTDGRVKPLYNLQSVYYRMLRGTKNDQTYPSFIDFFIIEKKESRICLQHASLSLLSSFFGERAANTLFHELQETDIPLTRQRIQDICHENGRLDVKEDVLDLFDWSFSRHHMCGQKTLVQKEADICLKQRFFLPS